jgi:hypothetical protein
MELAARIGQGHSARASLQQAHAQLGFQICHRF